MHRPVQNRLVYIDIAVPDFEVEATIRVGTDPRLIMDCCALATEVRQRYEVTRLALLAFGQIGKFH